MPNTLGIDKIIFGYRRTMNTFIFFRTWRLERLTKPIDEVPTDKSTTDGEKGLMNIGSAFIANLQAAKAIEPGQRPLHNPAMAKPD